jgi:hypothetical protein
MPSWSYSSLKVFQQCPKKYYHLRIAKDVQQGDTEATIYGKEVHKAAEDYMRDGTPIPEKFAYMRPILTKLETIKGTRYCEYEMGLKKTSDGYVTCDFYDPAYWWRGIADLLIVDDELAYMIDYKTSKSAKYADLKQLDAMAACIFRMFPNVKRIKSALLFVVSNEFVHKEHNCDTDYLKGFQFDLERLETAIATGTWNAVSGPLCGWCPVTSCVHYREPRKRR